MREDRWHCPWRVASWAPTSQTKRSTPSTEAYEVQLLIRRALRSILLVTRSSRRKRARPSKVAAKVAPESRCLCAPSLVGVCYGYGCGGPTGKSVWEAPVVMVLDWICALAQGACSALPPSRMSAHARRPTAHPDCIALSARSLPTESEPFRANQNRSTLSLHFGAARQLRPVVPFLTFPLTENEAVSARSLRPTVAISKKK